MSRTQEHLGTVLFVDDNVDTVQEHREALAQRADCGTYLCRSVDAAVRYLDRAAGGVGLVVIDLYMPGNYQLLQDYVSRVPGGLKSNHGQLLGAYLKERFSGIPFVYLSAFPDVFSGSETDRSEILFSKNGAKMDDFLQRCLDLLSAGSGS